MSLIKAVFFDFDDTLVSTNPIFDEIKLQFQKTMKEWELADEHLLKILDSYDIAHVKKCGGYAKECFPHALVDTYRHYCAKAAQRACARKIQEIEGLGWEALSRKPQLMEGVVDVLEQLSLSYRLFLITKGDRELQRRKIAESGLKKYFARIDVVLEKSDRVFQNLIDRYHIAPRESWSVGNSLKADINPALRAGMKGIHVQSSSWSFEHEEPAGEYYPVSTLKEILNIISPPAGKRERRVES